jgi:hypothetical protein
LIEKFKETGNVIFRKRQSEPRELKRFFDEQTGGTGCSPLWEQVTDGT